MRRTAWAVVLTQAAGFPARAQLNPDAIPDFPSREMRGKDDLEVIFAFILVLAIMLVSIPIVRMIVRASRVVLTQNGLFFGAIEHRAKSVVHLLLAMGANPNARKKEWLQYIERWSDVADTPLIRASSRRGTETIVQMLIAAGAAVNAHEVIMGRSGANSENDGGTALHSAVQCGSFTVAQMLIAAGADVNAEDQNSRSPLMAAADRASPYQRAPHEHAKDFERMVELLASAGATDGAAAGRLYVANSEERSRHYGGCPAYPCQPTRRGHTWPESNPGDCREL